MIDFDAENHAVQPETIETLLTSTLKWLKEIQLTLRAIDISKN